MQRLPRSRTFRRAATVAATLALSAALAEIALRLLPSGVVVEADLYRMDDGLLLLRPGVSRRHVTPRWDVDLTINNQGFRDFDREPRADETVALGLGDSQAFGWGVELEETLYARLEAGLAPNLRLIKAATPGTGTSDQARLLERLAPLYRPRAVLVSFFVGNDFVDVTRGGSAQYEVVAGFLAHSGEGAGAPRDLAIRSRLLQLLRAAQFRLGLAPERARRWDAWMREYAQVHLADPPESTRRACEETLAALDAIADQCRRAGAAPLVVVIPRSLQTDAAEAAEMARALGWTPDQLDLDRPQRLLGDWARERGVAIVDLLPAFRAHAEAGGEALFHTPDAHMTAAGHALAARLTQPALAAALAAPVDAAPPPR